MDKVKIMVLLINFKIKKPGYFLLIIAMLSLPFYAHSQMEGEIIKPEKGTFLLKNATVVTVTKGVIENADLLISNGVIKELGKGITGEGATEIDCTGSFVYPGMIDAGTRLGLVEVNSLPETQDYMELGNVTPNMQALTAVNPNAVAIPVTRVSGVTTTLAVPSGGVFSGTAALINLIGYTPDQMYAGFKGIVLNFPSTARRGTFDKRSEEDITEEAEKATKSLNEIWKKAEDYHKLSAAGAVLEYYPEMEHLSKAVSGEIPLLVEVNAAKDILQAIEWLEPKEVNAILTGVSEGWRVAEKIAEANLPVITGPILSLPSRQSDRYDASYSNAGKLLNAGITVAIRTNEAENVRNLPFHAGFAAAYGMGKEEALKAITIIPAGIFGVDDKLGSLEVGKNATLFISDGDPFEPKTQIKQVFIDGYRIPMTSRHIQLYQEFLERRPGLME